MGSERTNHLLWRVVSRVGPEFLPGDVLGYVELLEVLTSSMARLGGGVDVVAVGPCVAVEALGVAHGVVRCGLSGEVYVADTEPRCCGVVEELVSTYGLGGVLKFCSAGSLGRLGSADFVIAELGRVGEVHEFLKSVTDLVGKHSLLAIHGVLGSGSRGLLVVRLIRDYGLTRTVVPVGSGVLLATERVYSEDFLRESVRVWRDSTTQGPNPIPYNTAYLLYVLAHTILGKSRVRTVVEVGTGRGFSTMWLAIAVKDVGGKVYSFDVKCDRVEYAKEVMERVDLLGTAEVICGDVREYVDVVDGEVAMLFIDGFKREYGSYLKALEDKLVSGSVVITHNTVSNPTDMADYLVEVYSGKYTSVTVLTDPAGVTLSVRV